MRRLSVFLFLLLFPGVLLAEDRIDINKATASELTSVKGIGPKTAENILTWRSGHGPIKRMAELEAVTRIGPKTVAKLACKFYVPAEGPLPCGVVQTSKTKRTRKLPPALPPGQKINMNLATAQDIRRLNGFGPKKAAAVVAFREANGWFYSVDDLQDVKGIGPKTVERLRPVVVVKVNVNAATERELTALGLKNAREIVKLRNVIGRFNSLKDFAAAPGMDPKALKRVKRILDFGPRPKGK